MARMHSRKKGKASSTRPFTGKNPDWVALSADDIIAKIVELNNLGKSSAMIGTILRDQHGVPSVKLALERTIGDVLQSKGLEPKLPEDLSNLMRKALNLQEHLKDNKKDVHNKRARELTEAKIRRLVKYYHKSGTLPEGWKYSIKTAKLLVD